MDAPIHDCGACIGSLHAACRTLQKAAAKSSEAYDIAIAEVHKLTIQLQAMSCETTKDKPKGDLGRRFEVEDLVVVLTKGCGKKSKMGPPQQRKCSRCGSGGHIVRKCKTYVQRRGGNIEVASQNNLFKGNGTK